MGSRRFRRAVLVTCLSLFAFGFAGSAAAREVVVAPRFHVVRHDFKDVVSIGERYVVLANYDERPDRVWITDTKTLRTRTLILPQGCTAPEGEGSPHDRFLAWCDEGTIVISSATGKTLAGPFKTLGGLEASWPPEQWHFVGDQWLNGYNNVVLNWHTGERATYSDFDRPWDLDHVPFGKWRYCSPHQKRERAAVEEQDRGLVYFVIGKGARRAAYLGRCGSKTITRIHGLGGREYSLDTGSIVGGWALWSSTVGDGCGLTSYDVRTRTYSRWTTSPVARNKCFWTEKTKYAAVLTYNVGPYMQPDSDQGYRLQRLAIARRPS